MNARKLSWGVSLTLLAAASIAISASAGTLATAHNPGTTGVCAHAKSPAMKNYCHEIDDGWFWGRHNGVLLAHRMHLPMSRDEQIMARGILLEQRDKMLQETMWPCRQSEAVPSGSPCTMHGVIYREQYIAILNREIERFNAKING